MFEIIFIIVVILFVKKAKKKKTTSVSTRTVQSRPQQRPVQSRPQQRPVQSRPQATVAQNRPQTTRTPGKTVQSKPEEMSTTEMLEAKAQADDREEMLEKQRQNIANKKHYGHHNYAGKYIYGDPVPKGKKMVFCPYCNAENLIPTYSAAKDFNCYFCRETL